MTREDILKEILSLEGNNWLLELPTGVGKTKLSIEKVKQLKVKTLLLVVNRTVHKQNWIDEFNKWWKDRNIDITMTTYVSLPKYKGTYDAAIYDEAHHLSDRCREALCDFNVKYNILLSATVNSELKDKLTEVFDNLVVYKKTLKSVIDSEILPEPKVILLPLHLKTGVPTEVIIKNPKAKGRMIESSWAMRWSYMRQKTNPVRIHCTEAQYLSNLDSSIDYWKNRYMRTRSDMCRNKWLRLCNDRLTWLSNKKVSYVKDILVLLKDYRTLTFCNSIEQTELLGKYNINSKNKNSLDYLKLFNEGIINHITACNCLNEGINLYNCQVGIYNNLNSSDTIITQRIGRLLRHKKPIIIIPYFVKTREEELINKMKENFNKSLTKVINNITEIKDEINNRPNYS